MRRFRRSGQIVLSVFIAAGCCIASGGVSTAEPIELLDGLAAGSVADLYTDFSASVGASSFRGSPQEQDYAHRIFQDINQTRSDNGVAPLSVDAGLNTASWLWSEQMGITGTLQHSASNVGENVLYYSSLVSPEEMVQKWVESPAHYANLVNSGYTISGVGVSIANSGVWVTQQFN